MEKQFRTIVFVIPAALSTAVDASEMAADFLSKVEWLVDEVPLLETEIRRGILQAVHGSIRNGQSQVAVTVDVFLEDCIIRVSQRGSNAKQLTIHLTRDFTKRSEPDEEFRDDRKFSVS